MCSECKRIICPSSCPNFEPKAKHYCSVCEEGIYDGEEYVKMMMMNTDIMIALMV